jgi:hypothetical protein
MSEPTEIVQRVTRAMHCSKCGVEAAAACDCGAPYLPATARAAKAIAENPGKSNRAIAAEIGVDHKTVGAARKAGGEHSPPERVTGKDGKSYPARASNDVDPEASAEARKAEYAADDESESGCVTSADDSAPTKQPLRAEVARLIRAWVQASPEAKRQFIRERWDEIARSRKQLDANGADAEDRWIDGDTL